MNCQLLRGHTNILLALATTPENRNLLISSAKDGSVRMWLLGEKLKQMFCIGHTAGHTKSVNAIAISRISTKFFASISQDLYLTLWELPNNLKSCDQNLSLNITR